MKTDDPILTAYALGEALNDEEQRYVDALLASSPEARAFVEETRAFAGVLAAEFKAGEATCERVVQPEVLTRKLAEGRVVRRPRWRMWGFGGVGVAAALVLGMALLQDTRKAAPEMALAEEGKAVGQEVFRAEVPYPGALAGVSAAPLSVPHAREVVRGYLEPPGGMRGSRAASKLNVVDTEIFSVIPGGGFREVAVHPLSTVSLDVGTASYVDVRRSLREGRWPDKGAVRIEELINYFAYDYPPAKAGEPFAVSMEVGDCRWEPEHRVVRIALKREGAQNVEIQVEWNPAAVRAYRPIGAEDGYVGGGRISNGRNDNEAMGAGQSVTLLYEVILVRNAPSDELLSLKIRPGGDGYGKDLKYVLKNRDGAESPSRDFLFATAVAEFGMRLRASEPLGPKSSWDAVLKRAQENIGEDVEGRRREFVELVKRARQLSEEDGQER